MREEFFFPGWSPPPHILVPPVFIPPVLPPCEDDDPSNDKDCEPENPTDAPEPSLPVLIFLGAIVFWAFRKTIPYTEQ